jgi:hypothetical protein
MKKEFVVANLIPQYAQRRQIHSKRFRHRENGVFEIIILIIE